MIFRWLQLIKLDILAKAYSFWLAFLHIFFIWYSKFSLLSKLTPNTFSVLLFAINCCPILIQCTSMLLSRRCHLSSNNIASRHAVKSTETGIVITILSTVDTCKRNGVDDVYVSGITCRKEHQVEINKINEYLRTGTWGMDYTFVDNGNIKVDKHLWDGIHLNNERLII